MNIIRPAQIPFGSKWISVDNNKKYEWTEEGWVEVRPRKIVCFFSSNRRLNEYRDWLIKYLVAQDNKNPVTMIHNETTIKTDELEMILLVYNCNNGCGYRPDEIRVDSDLRVKDLMSLLILVDMDMKRVMAI